MKRPLNHRSGMSLIELVVYIAILALITIVIMNGILQLSGVFGRSRTERRVSLAAETALERMVRELRLAQSVLAIDPTDGRSINLHSYVSNSNASNQDKSFYCISAAGNCGQIIFDPNLAVSNDEQQLTPSTVTVSSLVFKQLYNPSGLAKSSAVRIEMTITSGSGQSQVTHTYYATAVLRGGY